MPKPVQLAEKLGTVAPDASILGADSSPGLVVVVDGKHDASDRLKPMEEHRLVERSFSSDHPPRAEYALTDKGRELGTVVGALAAWGSRHVDRSARLVHADSGKEARLGQLRADTGERVPGSAVRVRRGSRGTPARCG